MSILRNTGPTTLTYTWYDPTTGTATDAGAVTIGIVDADSTVVVASTSATNAGSGVYTYDLAVQTEVATLTVTWTAGTQSRVETVEVVGGWLFTENELRTFQNSDLASTSTYTDTAIAEVRDTVADEFEQICSVSFTPRYKRQTLPGTGTTALEVARPKLQTVIACTITGTTVAASSFDVDELAPVIFRTNGTFAKPSTSNPRNVTISYRHGHTSVPPDIKRAALILARERLIADITGSGPPERASSWTDATGSYQAFAANPDKKRWYGLKSVDTALANHVLWPI